MAGGLGGRWARAVLLAGRAAMDAEGAFSGLPAVALQAGGGGGASGTRKQGPCGSGTLRNRPEAPRQPAAPAGVVVHPPGLLAGGCFPLFRPLVAPGATQSCRVTRPAMAAKLKDGLFLGDAEAAQDIDFLAANKILKIINCSGRQAPNLYEAAGVRYLTYYWPQAGNCIIFDESNAVLDEIYSFIEESLAAGLSVLVHSTDGVSRACFCAAIYFMLKYRWTLPKTLTYLQAKRPDLSPRPGFMRQLSALNDSLQRVTRSALGDAAPAMMRRFTDWDVPLLRSLERASHGSSPVPLASDELLLTVTYVNSQAQPDSAIARARAPPSPSSRPSSKPRRRLTWIDDPRRRGTSHPHVPISPTTRRPCVERPPTPSYSAIKAGPGWVDLLSPSARRGVTASGQPLAGGLPRPYADGLPHRRAGQEDPTPVLRVRASALDRAAAGRPSSAPMRRAERSPGHQAGVGDGAGATAHEDRRGGDPAGARGGAGPDAGPVSASRPQSAPAVRVAERRRAQDPRAAAAVSDRDSATEQAPSSVPRARSPAAARSADPLPQPGAPPGGRGREADRRQPLLLLSASEPSLLAAAGSAGQLRSDVRSAWGAGVAGAVASGGRHRGASPQAGREAGGDDRRPASAASARDDVSATTGAGAWGTVTSAPSGVAGSAGAHGRGARGGPVRAVADAPAVAGSATWAAGGSAYGSYADGRTARTQHSRRGPTPPPRSRPRRSPSPSSSSSAASLEAPARGGWSTRGAPGPVAQSRRRGGRPPTPQSAPADAPSSLFPPAAGASAGGGRVATSVPASALMERRASGTGPWVGRDQLTSTWGSPADSARQQPSLAPSSAHRTWAVPGVAPASGPGSAAPGRSSSARPSARQELSSTWGAGHDADGWGTGGGGGGGASGLGNPRRAQRASSRRQERTRHGRPGTPGAVRSRSSSARRAGGPPREDPRRGRDAGSGPAARPSSASRGRPGSAQPSSRWGTQPPAGALAGAPYAVTSTVPSRGSAADVARAAYGVSVGAVGRTLRGSGSGQRLVAPLDAMAGRPPSASDPRRAHGASRRHAGAW